MSKSLRVFLLSALVVVLSMSAAFAATDWTNLAAHYNANTIYLNGNATLTDTDITGDVNTVRVKTGSKSTLTLNTKTSIPGTWNIIFEDEDGIDYDTSVEAPGDLDKYTELTITRTDANTSIKMPAGATTYTIPKNARVVFNVAFRNDEVATFAIKATALDGGYLGFGSYVEVFDDITNLKNITGFKATADIADKASLTANTGGTIAVAGGTSIMTGSVDITIRDKGVLSLDVGGTKNLTDATITLVTKDSVIRVNGSNSLTLNTTAKPVLTLTANAFTKAGSGTLSIGTNGLPADASANVNGGTLDLTGAPTMKAPTANTAKFTVAAGAKLNVSNRAIVQSDDATVEFTVRNNGLVTLADKAVIGVNELYPHNTTDYNGSLNNTIDLVGGIAVNVSEDASKLIINGMQTVNSIEGHGTIEVNGSTASKDTGVMILRPITDESDYIDFQGTINGTNANVGLYVPGTNYLLGVNNGVANADYEPRIFRSADVDIDNLIVYGGVALSVNEKTNIASVDNIWLRSDRPGSKAETGLTIGALNIEDTDTTDEVYPIVSGLKIDGTSSAAGMAVINSYGYTDYENGVVNQIPDPDYINTIENVTLYANRDVDFGGTYPKKGIYAVKLAADSVLVWDGTNTKGDAQAGEAADFYQIQLEDGTTLYANPYQSTQTTYLKLVGSKPLAIGNNLLVGLNAGLEVKRGATLGGNLKFAGYNRFITQVGSNNRKLNEGGEFAVEVEGNLALSADPNNASNRRVRVAVQPDLDAFIGINTTTVGQRFKALGSLKGASAYTPGYNVDDYSVINGNAVDFGFARPSEDDDTQQVTVECQEELAMLSLGSPTFVEGGTTFGLAGGREFIIKIPYSLTYRGQALGLVKDEDPTHSGANVLNTYGLYKVTYDNIDHYTVGFCSNFGTYENGAFVNDPNDKSAAVDMLVRDDITCRVEYSYGANPEDQYVTLVGTAYKESVDIDLWVYLNGTGGNPISTLVTFSAAAPQVAVASDMVIDAFKHFTLIREGAAVADSADKFSDNMATEPVGDTTFTVGENGLVKFRVYNMRKVTYQNAAAPVLSSNGTYVWMNGAAEDAYIMRDANGIETRVDNVALVVYDGDYSKRTTTTLPEITEGFTIDSDPAGGVVVSLPVSMLGNTHGQISAIKGLSLAGKKADGGRIMTTPVSVTLVTAPSSSDKTIAVGPEMSKTVTISGDAVSGLYDINPSDLSGDIHLVTDGLPSWLGWTGNGAILSYTTGNIPADAVGTHTFKVIAYSGENSTSSKHVVYTFTINVLAGSTSHDVPVVEPAISGDTAVTVKLPDGTATVTLSLVGGATGTFAVSGDTNPAGLLTVTPAGVVTVNAAGVAPGTYAYTITVGALRHILTVTVQPEGVPAPVEFGIEEVYNGFTDYNPVANHTYYATFAAVGTSRDVTWSVANRNADGDTFTYRGEMHTAVSGDMFVVEGTVAEGAEQGFVVTAASGGQTAETEVTFDVDADEITSYTAIAATAGTHTAVTTGYRVNFPSGVVADVDAVFLPIWLRPVLNADDEVIGVEFAGRVGNLANGTAATVFVEATDADGNNVYYNWNVVYGAAAPLAITASQTALTLSPDATATVTMTANVEGVTYSSDKAWAVVSGDTVTITAPAATDTVTITGTDTAGRTAAATITVTVSGGSEPLPGGDFMYSLTGSTTVSVALAARDTSITITPRNVLGTVSYTSSASWVSVNSSTGVVTINPTNSSLVSSTPHTVTITLTDSGRTTDNTQRVTLTITVTSGGVISPDQPSVQALSLRVSPSPLNITLGNIGTVRLSATNVWGTATYSMSAPDEVGGIISGDTAVFVPEEVGTHTVTFTVVDSGRTTDNSATAALTVNVTLPSSSVGSSGGGCDAGFGALALVLAAPLFLRRRRS